MRGLIYGKIGIDPEDGNSGHGRRARLYRFYALRWERRRSSER
jgi:hypothetical protein